MATCPICAADSKVYSDRDAIVCPTHGLIAGWEDAEVRGTADPGAALEALRARYLIRELAEAVR